MSNFRKNLIVQLESTPKLRLRGKLLLRHLKGNRGEKIAARMEEHVRVKFGYGAGAIDWTNFPWKDVISQFISFLLAILPIILK